MKNNRLKISYFILISFIIIFPFIAQSNNDFVKMKIYLSPWKNKYNTPSTIDNIHERTSCFFQTKTLVFGEHSIFEDHDTWHDFIRKQTLFDGDKIGGFVISYVVIQFRYKKVKLFFDDRGRFNYDKKWYNRNDELYLSIFLFFSDYLVPNYILSECENNFLNTHPNQ